LNVQDQRLGNSWNADLTGCYGRDIFLFLVYKAFTIIPISRNANAKSIDNINDANFNVLLCRMHLTKNMI